MATDEDLYLVTPLCPLGRPHVTQDLIGLYDLKDLAASVARQDPQTGAKRKLRKSYKGHVASLPGKHPVPNADETPFGLVAMAMQQLQQPAKPTLDPTLTRVSDDLLGQLLFERSNGGVPGFDAKLLAAPGAQQGAASPVATTPGGGHSSHPASPGGDLGAQQHRKRSTAGPLPQEKRRKL